MISGHPRAYVRISLRLPQLRLLRGDLTESVPMHLPGRLVRVWPWGSGRPAGWAYCLSGRAPRAPARARRAPFVLPEFDRCAGTDSYDP